MAERDGSGDLILRGEAAQAPVDGPRWLGGLRRGDTLVFKVIAGEAQQLEVRFRLTRLVQRGKAVAGLFEPEFAPDYPGELHPYWLAGDEEALWQLDRHPQLIEAGFVPLTPAGRVIADVRQESLFWLPQGLSRRAQSGGGEGWVVEELSMKLEGPVRGDRCAHVRRASGTEAVVVCGDVGIVQVDFRRDMQMGEHWELIEIRRADASGT